jgi:uncharacterized membrane protein
MVAICLFAVGFLAAYTAIVLFVVEGFGGGQQQQDQDQQQDNNS